MSMTNEGHWLDIESIYAEDDHLWIVSAWPGGQVELHHGPRLSLDEIDESIAAGLPTGLRFDLTPDEAHELGTKLRLMARKAKAARDSAPR